MNRRQLLRLGAMAAVAPRALVTPAQERVIGIGMLQAVNPAAAVAWAGARPWVPTTKSLGYYVRLSGTIPVRSLTTSAPRSSGS